MHALATKHVAGPPGLAISALPAWSGAGGGRGLPLFKTLAREGVGKRPALPPGAWCSEQVVGGFRGEVVELVGRGGTAPGEGVAVAQELHAP